MLKYITILFFSIISISSFSQINLDVDEIAVLDTFANGNKKVEVEIMSTNYYRYTEYYNNGQIRENGYFQNGVRHNTWESYDKGGNKKMEITMKNGKKHGDYKVWENGKLIAHIIYRRGKMKEGYMINDGELLVKN